jgi:DNA replication protein DnaC
MEPSNAFCNRCSNNKFIIKSQDRASDRYALAVICSYCKKRCEICLDRGYTITEKNSYEYVKSCNCQTIPKQISLFNRAQIPAQYASKLFLPFKSFGPGAVSASQERAFFHIQDWAKGFLPGQKGFVLIGSCGLGKTLLLCQALRILTLTRGEFCRYVEFSTLLEDLKEKIQENRDGATTESIRESLKNATVLVVDELGKGLRTEWEQSQLDTLISERYYAGKTTLFATNHHDEGQTNAPLAGPTPRFGPGSRKENPVETESLAKRVGQRLYSRLREFCEFIEIEGEDYRLQETKSKKTK